jgi:hypothetical protein
MRQHVADIIWLSGLKSPGGGRHCQEFFRSTRSSKPRRYPQVRCTRSFRENRGEMSIVNSSNRVFYDFGSMPAAILDLLRKAGRIVANRANQGSATVVLILFIFNIILNNRLDDTAIHQDHQIEVIWDARTTSFLDVRFETSMPIPFLA